jgi:hypothetical protein
MARRLALARCVCAAPRRRKFWEKLVVPVEITRHGVAVLVYDKFLDPRHQTDRAVAAQAATSEVLPVISPGGLLETRARKDRSCSIGRWQDRPASAATGDPHHADRSQPVIRSIPLDLPIDLSH